MSKPKISRQETDWLLSEKHSGKQTAAFFADLARLEAGEPLDYIIGFSRFYNCKIDLRYRPLIPRPETEFWAERLVKDEILTQTRPQKVLDIFSGSGCVGVAVLKNSNNSLVHFAEINPSFVKQIKFNLKLNKIPDRKFKVIKSNIFSGLKEKYDLILANPPYLDPGRKTKVQPSVLGYEPEEALFAADKGLGVIKKFLKQAPKHLLPQGTICLEFDSWQKSAIKRLLEQEALRPVFYRDQFNRWRYVKIVNNL